MAAQRENEQQICLTCIGDEALRNRVEGATKVVVCPYCGESRPGIPFEHLVHTVDRFLRDYCEPGDELPVFHAESDHVYYEQEGESLVGLLQSELEIDYEVAEALAEILIAEDPARPQDGDDPFYGADVSYVRSYVSTDSYARDWEDFADAIKHVRRFFDDGARTRLARILGSPGDRRADDLPVFKIGPQTRIPVVYRGRRADSDAEAQALFDDLPARMGPPRPENATPGRMNPAGISVFYGACSIDTAVAELRPSVGGLVVVGEFEVLRQLRLLDLSRIRVAFSGSIFAEDYEDQASRAQFLQSFHELIARPVHPNQETLDYIPTQAVAEYVSNVLGFDGILYASAQLGAVPEPEHTHYVNVEPLGDDELQRHNVVLFRDAGSVVGKPESSTAASPLGGNNSGLAISARSVAAHRVTRVAYQHEGRYLPGVHDGF